MKRVLFSLLSLALAASPLVAAAEKAPNIILILVDDMGWGDFSPDMEGHPSVNGPAIQTPKLAEMAQLGVQLRQHYTAAPVCAPARASLFSGVHQGHAEVIRNNSFDAALENSHTLASVLKQAGYATALIGKWGIGGGKEQGGTPATSAAWPTKRGFDYFFGYHNHIAGHRHYPKEESSIDPDTHCNAVWDNDTVITEQLDTCYSTDLFTARAKKWVVETHAANPDKPFFLALTLIAPHARLAVPSVPYPAGGGLKGGVQWLGTPGHMINTAEGKWDSYLYPYANRAAWQGYAQQRFGAGAEAALDAAQRHATMITRVDDAVGDLMQLLRDLKLDDNTFVVFTSDNGPHNEPGAVGAIADHPAPRQNPAFFRSYGIFDGIKRDVLEGGLRVPCIVYAPKLIQHGVINTSDASQFQDWMATFADLAGVPKPMRCDGVSLLPLLRGEKPNEGVVYAEYAFGGTTPQYPDFIPGRGNHPRGEQQVIFFRDGASGKLLKAERTNMQTGEEDFEIYDVQVDTHEAHNLAEQYADKQAELRTAAAYNRRAYDYYRDPAVGIRGNLCGGFRPYDAQPVPANTPAAVRTGWRMRRVAGTPPWVPDFDTLPNASEAEAMCVENPFDIELPAGTVTEFRGFIEVPFDGLWHFWLTAEGGERTRAYMKMHHFQLIDADANYTPGTAADCSSAANTEEALPERTGKKGLPLRAGLHEVTLTVVQGQGAPGKLRLEWQKEGAPRVAIPTERLKHCVESER